MKSEMTFDKVTLPDGRRMSFGRFGDLSGKPVLFLHGFPGSQLQAKMVCAQAKNNGACLIAPDRPGFGYSDFDQHRTLISTCNDFQFLMAKLGYQRFAVIGVSCGGAYALGCAYAFTQQVTAVGLLAGIGPMHIPAIKKDQLKVLTILFWLARHNPKLAIPLILLDCLMFRKSPESAIRVLSKLLTQPDRELLQINEQVRLLFGKSLAEGYRQGLTGALQEAHIIGSSRPYSLGEISTPIEVFQGKYDKHVPPAMGHYIASNLPNGRFHFNNNAGHLSIVVSEIERCLQLILNY